jgi:WD40 repeat protein/uncharacterized caspase-like protein
MNSNTKPKAQFALFIFIFFLFTLFTQLVIAKPPSWPPENPIPRVETVMHTASIWRLSIDAQERFLVTASKDKTARVWDLNSGNLQQILRVPMGELPDEGQLFCVAISPDGKKVAAAGYTGKKKPRRKKRNFSIYIFDRASGHLEHTISGLPLELSHLTFSRDGKYLAATIWGTEGIRVYSNSRNWPEVYKDTNYKGDCLWADFDTQNRLVTTSWDGYFRLYELRDGKFENILKEKVRGGAYPITARFSPDGSLLAVGFKDRPPRVVVFSGKSLKRKYTPNTKGLKNGYLPRVAWSRDGNLLYAGGRFNEAGVHPILRWTKPFKAPATRWPVALNSIMDIWPLKDGRLVFGAADPAFGVLDPSGSRLWTRIPDILDFRNRQKELRISADGRVVEFGFSLPSRDLTRKSHVGRIDITTFQFTLDPPPDPVHRKLRPPNTKGFRDKDWKDTSKPRFRKRLLYDSTDEESHCLARIPGGQGFILGTNWFLHIFDQKGEHRNSISLPSSAYGVNVSGDGQVAIATLGDGTLHWYRLADLKEILAFFRHRDGRWVMWSPEGFFTCSPDGGKLIGYHRNQGPKKTPQFVSSDQLFDQFYRRDLVTWHLVDPPKGEIPTALRKGDVKEVLAGGPPPTVEILKLETIEQDVVLRVKVTDQGGGIGKVTYRINGVAQEPGKSRSINPFETPGQKDIVEEIRFALEPNIEQKFSVTAQNVRGVESRPDFQTVDAAKAPKKVLRSLHVLAIGVSDYRGNHPYLPFAATDAEKIARAFESQGKGIFKDVIPKTLLNEAATLASIAKAFKEKSKEVNPGDVFVVYLAGHGTIQKGRYHFIPFLNESFDEFNSPTLQANLSQKQLEDWLSLINTTSSLVILDTCHAGAFANPQNRGPQRENVEKTAFVTHKKNTGRAILASCSDHQVALEGYEKNGVFTHFLLKGLKEKAADSRGDGNERVTLFELVTLLRNEVPKKTEEKWKYQQKPRYYLADQGELELASLSK